MDKAMTQYVWRIKTRLPERYMTLCHLLARGKMNTCLVEFDDGYRATTSRNYLMKLETLQKRELKRALQSVNHLEDKYLG
jgi:uncharacterized protein (UPF0216 family)